MKKTLKNSINSIILVVALTGLLSIASTNARASAYAWAVTNTPNLLGYWRFDSLGANTSYHTNSWSGGYTGTLHGNAQFGSGPSLPGEPANQGLLLDGASYLSTSLTYGITNGGTVLAWVYLTNQPSAAGHFFQITSQSQSGNDFDFQFQTDNKLYFFTDSGSSTVYPNALPLNQWHFLAATFVVNSTRCIYLDGKLVASSIAGSHSANSNPFCIGYNLTFPGRYFQGKIDEVAVYSRALSSNEIAAIYSTAFAPTLNIASTPQGTVLTWPTNFAGFTLQTNNSLTSGVWGALATTYGIVSTNYAVTNAVSVTRLFYRLIK